VLTFTVHPQSRSPQLAAPIPVSWLGRSSSPCVHRFFTRAARRGGPIDDGLVGT